MISISQSSKGTEMIQTHENWHRGPFRSWSNAPFMSEITVRLSAKVWILSSADPTTEVMIKCITPHTLHRLQISKIGFLLLIGKGVVSVKWDNIALLWWIGWIFWMYGVCVPQYNNTHCFYQERLPFYPWFIGKYITDEANAILCYSLLTIHIYS